MTHLYSDHRRILLIDQNITKRNLRATILRNYEIEVQTASRAEEAASLLRTHAYDLVLLATQENSEEADELCARLRAIRPRQRIGLLVGPPAFVLELGGAEKKPARKKVASIGGVLPSRILGDPRVLVPPHAPSPQWQEMIRRMVTEWYVGSSGLLGLSKVEEPTAGA